MERIGRYEILQELGRGAMGAVYKARDPEIGRVVALKVILTANLAPEELERFKQRFRREAQAAGQMSHPGIVTIHDIAEDERGQPFLVMEYIEGATLNRLLQPTGTAAALEPLPLEKSLDLALQVAEALDYAHRRGVVHRDIKPANVLVTPEGRAKITDFGIAKFTDSEATHTTSVMGTPAYMAPEQVRAGKVDGRSDIFSLGAVLYWMCAGQKPFQGETTTSISFNVVYADPEPVRRLVPALPEELETILSRCLAKNPEHRYATAGELARDLRALREGRPITATPAPRAAPVDDTVTMTGPVPPRALDGNHTAKMPAPAVPAEPRTARDPSIPEIIPTPVGRSQQFVVLGVVALVAFLIGSFALWRIASPAPPERPAAPTKAGAPAKAPTAAVPPTKKAAPVATSSVEVECRHNFQQATLEVFLGRQRLLSEKLEGKSGVFGRTTGSLKASVAVPAGNRTLRVRVVSADPKDPYEEQGEISATFAQGETRRLLVEFGRGSGAGLSKRKLQLKWR
jgi:serine/threonine-protein kinase